MEHTEDDNTYLPSSIKVSDESIGLINTAFEFVI